MPTAIAVAATCEANKQLVRRWFEEVWNQGSEAAIDEMFTVGGKAHGFPYADSVLDGPEPFKTVHRQFRGAFPDVQMTLDEIVAEDDRVAVRWTVHLTHLGDHLGIPASRRRATASGSSFLRCQDGKILEGWNLMDMNYLLNQLR